MPGALVIVTDGAGHDEAKRQRCVDWLFARRSFDKIRARHHRNEACHPNILESRQFAGGKNGFHVGITAGFAEGLYFVVECLPVASQDMSTRDYNVDLFRACLYRFFDLGDLEWKRSLGSGKTSRDGGDRDICAFQRFDSNRDQVMVDADRANGEM